MRIIGSFILISFLLLTASCTPQPEVQEGAAGEAPASEEALTSRILIETSVETDPEAVAATLSGRLGAPVLVERLFPDVEPSDDPEGLARMFLAHVPPEAGESSWDTAYRLRDDEELALVRVEPDQERTLELGLESTGACKVDYDPPPDHRWSLENINAPAAWDLPPEPGGAQLGEGIRVCHPDTGWSDHIELASDRLDLESALNLLKDGSPDAKDPLNYEGSGLHPGHGTATGTAIVSSPDGEIGGVAPGAQLVPIRTAKSVIQIFDSDLARAINHAVKVDCDVVSMSMGGRGFFGLKGAIKRAVRKDLLVMAAAGNCVKFVVAPASYDHCLAIAGNNVNDQPWPGSCRGKAVDITAPAEHVWSAKRRPGDASTENIYAAQGTSFSVANVAGAAALWMSHHGVENLKAKYTDTPLQKVFREQLRQTARTPEDWNTSKLGAGILDVKALLEEPLPPQQAMLDMTEAEPMPEAEALIDLSRVVDRSPSEMAVLMARFFETSTDQVNAELDRWGPELTQLALENPPAFEELLEALSSPEEAAVMGARELLPGASATLKRSLEGR